MDVSKKILDSQGSLSRLNLDFLDFVKKNPAALKRSSFKLLELNDPLFTLQSWPTFINKKTRDTFEKSSLGLWELIKSIPKRVFDNDPYRISQYFELPVNLIKIQFDGITDEYINNLVARGDFIYSSDGLKCLEYNVSSNLGGLQIPIWESLALSTPLITQFFKEYNVKNSNENLISLFLEQIAWLPLKNLPNHNNQPINVAIVMDTKNINLDKEKSAITYLNKLYQGLLRKKNPCLTGEVFVCGYPSLKAVDNEVFYHDKKVHAFAEMLHGLVPPPILNASKAGNVSITNGPITNLMSNKLMLALLSDHQTLGVFTEDEKKLIDNYVPWSRKILPGSTTYRNEPVKNMEEFLLSHRERLVIKPSTGLGGDGVCIGSKCSEKQWQTVVTNALHKKNWLVQERVEALPSLYQAGDEGAVEHDAVWGFFMFGTRYAGAWVRVMPKEGNLGVINCHQGATVSIIFFADEV